jgi:hypothetical protein
MRLVKNEEQLCSGHATKRLYSRYGKRIDVLLSNGILSRIRMGKGKLIRRMGNSGRMVFKVRYRNSYCVVVNKDISSIITFLPLNETQNCGNLH